MTDTSVLIVDDSEADRYLLKRQINKLGMDVAVFENDDGSGAIDFLGDYDANVAAHGSRFPPSYVFLDINMPILDGWGFLDAFATLKESNPYRTVVIAMFTSSDRPEDRAKADSYGFVASYLVKGDYDDQQLIDLLSAA